jgi:hypothetical protein
VFTYECKHLFCHPDGGRTPDLASRSLAPVLLSGYAARRVAGAPVNFKSTVPPALRYSSTDRSRCGRGRTTIPRMRKSCQTAPVPDLAKEGIESRTLAQAEKIETPPKVDTVRKGRLSADFSGRFVHRTTGICPHIIPEGHLPSGPLYGLISAPEESVSFQLNWTGRRKYGSEGKRFKSLTLPNQIKDLEMPRRWFGPVPAAAASGLRVVTDQSRNLSFGAAAQLEATRCETTNPALTIAK